MIEDQAIRERVKYDADSGAFYVRGKTKTFLLKGHRRKDGYVEISVKNKTYLAHRLAFFLTTGEWPENVDHINMDRADNRLVNLRAADRSLNMANTKSHKDSKTGLKGVTFDKPTRKFRAQVMVAGRQNYLGIYDCPAAANFAYQVAASRLFGKFARPL